MLSLLQVLPISAFSDNYIWLLTQGTLAWVVDPGDAEPVKKILAEENLQLAGILVTHHHNDHVGGIAELLQHYPVDVYGPIHSPAAALITHPLHDGEVISIGSWLFEVMAIPGHTLDHIAFYCSREKLLFCGDTLFSAGCGRVFEGSYEQMYMSLLKLAVLPDDTRVCCAHEYTLSNLRFAHAVEPGNIDIQVFTAQCEQWRAQKKPTLPSTIGREKTVNPFLRCQNVEEFSARREWKNNF
jgi:hydroxyacylglutathione hydrolase